MEAFLGRRRLRQNIQPRSMDPPFLQELPPELQLSVINDLSVSDIASLSFTSKSFHNLISHSKQLICNQVMSRIPEAVLRLVPRPSTCSTWYNAGEDTERRCGNVDCIMLMGSCIHIYNAVNRDKSCDIRTPQGLVNLQSKWDAAASDELVRLRLLLQLEQRMHHIMSDWRRQQASSRYNFDYLAWRFSRDLLTTYGLNKMCSSVGCQPGRVRHGSDLLLNANRLAARISAER